MTKNTQTDNELCGGCGAHFETESHALNCPNAVTGERTAARKHYTARGLRRLPTIDIQPRDIVLKTKRGSLGKFKS